MLKYGDKEYRNLQEQVLANMRNIEDIIKDKPKIDAETRVGTYPRVLDTTGILNVEETVGNWVKNKKVDFKNHTISAGAYLYFYYPELLEHYGLHGDKGASSIPYSAYILGENVTLPETITTEAQLKAYVKSPDFAGDLDVVEYVLDEDYISNNVATYHSDIQFIEFNGTNVVASDSLDCQQGEGKQIVGASDPITEHILKTKNLKVENLEVENVNGKPVCRALYVHRLAFTIGGTSRFYHRIISTKGEPYTSISAVFADKANNSIDNVIMVDFVPMGSMGLLKFSDAGAVVDAVGIIGGNPGAFDTIGKDSVSFVSDEVVGRWNA